MITDYINNDGLLYGYSTLSYLDAKKISCECWDTKSGSVVTIEKNGFDFEIIFDHGFKKVGESIVSYDVSNHMLLEVLKFELLFLSVFEYDDEVVIFLQNDINIHLQKGSLGELFSMLKIVSNVTELSRSLVKNLMDEITLSRAEKLILR